LTVKGEVIGTLTAVNNIGKPIFAQSDLDLVAMLASQAAIAIENAHLFEQAERRAEDLETLAEVVERITTTITDHPPKMLEWTLRESPQRSLTTPPRCWSGLYGVPARSLGLTVLLSIPFCRAS
jgi:hypothetical protein